MDKNMMLAIGLSIAIVVGFQYFLKDLIMPESPKTEVAKTEEKAAVVKAEPADSKTDKKKTSKTALKQVVREPETRVKAEKTIVVENDLYKVVLSSRGASVREVELKNYKDKDGNRLLFKSDDKLPALAMGFDDELQYATADFEVTGSDVKLDDKQKSADIVFEYKSGEIRVKRTLTFTHGDYAIGVRDEVKGHSSYFVIVGKNFGIVEKQNADHFGPVLLKDSELITFTTADVKKATKLYTEKVKWIAQEDKYFAAIIVPKSPIEEARAWAKEGDALIGFKAKGGDSSYIFYTGPKELSVLEKYNSGMEHIIDFGIFSIVARPLFWLLNWINSLVGNYGWALIIFTFVTRLPFIPLIQKGQKSMKKMGDIQPKLVALREQFKKDPERMQKEVMAMYKKHKINPVGGCLPMVLQIPFFIALYAILSTAIELRQAPFIWWIKDLSEPDNLFGEMMGWPFVLGPLPLLMGATMFLMQKMTPSSADPMQQKMMLILPVIFTFMFLNFSSGLVLFWLISNVLSIIQQFFINREKPEASQS
jgi:YidC/Oxa1 family membrane protein insertase